ncbi:MAG: hypothetical protein BGO28_02590 [Alphaproteobacteria bacterium 43-37]|nr:MAG: hypothetical protein BGO28_02590 [Alphaproteobacteria bacterium 43-37]
MLAPASYTQAQTSNIATQTSASMQRWDLTDLFLSPTDPRITSTLAAITSQSNEFVKKYKGRIGELSAKTLFEALQAYEAIAQESSKLVIYSHLRFYSDQNNQENVRFKQEIEEKVDAIAKSLAFFELEVSALDLARTQEFLATHSGLTQYQYWLNKRLRERPHLLPEETEKLLIDLSGPSSGDWSTLADNLTTQIKVKVGEEEMNLNQATNIMNNALNPELRKQAFEAISGAYNAHADTFTIIYNALFKTAATYDDWRHFEKPGDARHLSNGIDREDVNALASAVTKKYESIAGRYYTLKAKWLGKNRLDLWDRNAPLPWREEKQIPFEEARDIVLAAYQAFSPEFAAQAKLFFTNRWIDVPLVDGKYFGAFNYAIPGHHPFILLNYRGTSHDVRTLAHEVGHGVHGLLSKQAGALQYQPPVTIAETASIFGEILTFKHLLSKESNPKQRLALLASFVEDMISSTLRQINFHEFEMRIHEARKNGPLSTKDIQTFWMETQTKIYGSSFNIPENYQNGWMGIPHFRRPFYVYAYAFGQCLVNTLYQTYKTNPGQFHEHYFNILKAGNSKPYTELLAPLGLNPKDPEFWDKGMQFIESMLKEIEKLDQEVANLNQNTKL